MRNAGQPKQWNMAFATVAEYQGGLLRKQNKLSAYLTAVRGPGGEQVATLLDCNMRIQELELEIYELRTPPAGGMRYHLPSLCRPAEVLSYRRIMMPTGG